MRQVKVDRASSRLPEGTTVRLAVQPGRHGGVSAFSTETRERTHFYTVKANAGNGERGFLPNGLGGLDLGGISTQ